MPERPNVLFVLADQLRAASLPVYGETQIAAPNIDRLAGRGRRPEGRRRLIELPNF